MSKLSRELAPLGTLHPRESLLISGALASLNAEIVVYCDSCGTVALDLRGTFVGTVAVQGTVDGANWVLIPIRSQLGGIFLLGATAVGLYMASCAGFTRVKAVLTAFTSGSATTVVAASLARFDDFASSGAVASAAITNTAAAAAAVTLTLPAPGVGLRNYITNLEISKFASASLVAGATPVLVTTTNLPGPMVFSLPADAAAAGTLFSILKDFAYPVQSTAQNTATTIAAPGTTSIIWRLSAQYYVAP